MKRISDCPFGFEDGHIVAYRAESSRLEVDYKFWNERNGKLVFEGLVGVRDNSAIGVTVSSANEKHPSEFIDALIRRRFENPPEGLHWRHFQFLDLDGQAMFEVVAESCSYAE